MTENQTPTPDPDVQANESLNQPETSQNVVADQDDAEPADDQGALPFPENDDITDGDPEDDDNS